MRKHLKIFTILVCCLSVLLLSEATNLFAQLAPEVAKMGYPDTIFVNGKVVSMDDISNSTEVGTIYQALAVKRDRIMKLGTSAGIRALAGPDTTIYDLQGRTLIPGIIEPHSHMYGRAIQYLDRLGFKYPPDGVLMATAQAELSLEETQANLRDALKESVEKANPGDWIVLRVNRHPAVACCCP